MSVAALSTAGFSQYISDTSNVSASQQAFQSLQESLASGNLAQAQSAFNTYNQLNEALSTATGSSSSSSTTSTGSQLSTDMKALGSAISSGSLSTAQSAFATVQGDLKSTPSQSVTNAESAVAQTVQWVDDLLNLSSSNNEDSAPVDPATAILNSAYGLSNSTTTTDPTTSILDSAYGVGGASANPAADPTSSPIPNSGNSGSSSSVNVYA